jgi:hypothetical protein
LARIDYTDNTLQLSSGDCGIDELGNQGSLDGS